MGGKMRGAKKNVIHDARKKKRIAELYVSGLSAKKIYESEKIPCSTFYYFLNNDPEFAAILRSVQENYVPEKKVDEVVEKKEDSVESEKSPKEKLEEDVPVSQIIEKAKRIILRALDRGDLKIALEIYKIYRPKEGKALVMNEPSVIESHISAKEEFVINNLAMYAQKKYGGGGLRMVQNE